MLGAIVVDIGSSVYEWHNVKTKDFLLLVARHAFFTDDAVLTVTGEEDLAETAWGHLPGDLRRVLQDLYATAGAA